MHRIEAAGGRRALLTRTWKCSIEHENVYMGVCLEKETETAFLSPVPELPWVPPSHSTEPRQSYLEEMRSQLKKRVIDQTMWITPVSLAASGV